MTSGARSLDKKTIVAASIGDVWQAWTSVEGVRGFFAPNAKIDLRLGGAYEMLFDASQPAGQQGSEGCHILAIEAPRRLVFTWSFPPSLPTIRGQHTEVSVSLESTADGQTQVALCQTGWQEGGEWEQGYAYFDRAWSLVLERLAARFESGPIDWSAL